MSIHIPSTQLTDIKHQRVLFCVLDWGLGHATRSSGIIEQLLLQHCQVHIASDSMAADFLRQRYPQLQHHELPSYNIRYTPQGFSPLQMLIVGGRTLLAIHREKRTIATLVEQIQPDIIVSDNRYGCYHPSITSICITHQLQLMFSIDILRYASRYIIAQLLEPFDAVWIPDLESVKLSGAMSEPRLNMPKHFIGFFTHFDTKVTTASPPHQFILGLISGPEPTRTAFERELIARAESDPHTHYILVAGRASEPYHTYTRDNLTYHSFLHATDLQPLIVNAQLVICRGGYSTLTDLLCLGQYHIHCMPTPGQVEQEYLATYAPSVIDRMTP